MGPQAAPNPAPDEPALIAKAAVIRRPSCFVLGKSGLHEIV
ncbi:Hypothetical protein A7982_01445 [Minicystis rosea]|nr:Hypothetical protein A7982_01445 [Minicystis rosea]